MVARVASREEIYELKAIVAMIKERFELEEKIRELKPAKRGKRKRHDEEEFTAMMADLEEELIANELEEELDELKAIIAKEIDELQNEIAEAKRGKKKRHNSSKENSWKRCRRAVRM